MINYKQVLILRILQNNDLLMKPDSLMEVDSYNLTEETYIASEDGNSYSTMEEQLNMNNMEKSDNEYLLPDTMPFEDADSNILQSNLEVFASQVLDNNSLLLYDKSRLRQNKKHPAEHLGFDYCKNKNNYFISILYLQNERKCFLFVFILQGVKIAMKL